MFTSLMENKLDELIPELLQPHHKWEKAIIEVKIGYKFTDKKFMSVAGVLKRLPEDKRVPMFYLNFLERWGKIYHTLNQPPFLNPKQELLMVIDHEPVKFIPILDDPFGLDAVRKDLSEQKIYFVTKNSGIFVQDKKEVIQYITDLIWENNYGKRN